MMREAREPPASRVPSPHGFTGDAVCKAGVLSGCSTLKPFQHIFQLQILWRLIFLDDLIMKRVGIILWFCSFYGSTSLSEF